MDKRNRKAFPLNFDGEIGNVRCTLGERILLRQRLGVAVSKLSYSTVGIVIVGGYKEELQWYWLHCIHTSQSVVIIKHLHTHPTIDFVLLVLGLLLHHKQRMVKQVQLQIAAVPLDTTTFVQSTFIDKLATFLLQT